MYHAHSGLLTVDGALIVDGTGPRSQQALKYDEERTIMLQDWWHTTPQQQMIGLLSSPTFRWIGDPSSILINGRTKSSPETCTPVSATNSTPLYATDFSTIPVTLGKTYRLRFIGATSLAYLSVAIAGHNLTVIEVDGSLVTPVVVDHIDVAPGQRYSVLMTADQPIGDYWMATAVRWRPSGPKNGLAIIRYDSAVRTTSYRSYKISQHCPPKQ
jgi:L-ascorbate oxidase